MRVGSLFSGIGGFDLGLERAGMSVAWQCEIDPNARAILRKHWPEVPCYGDIRSIDWSTVEPVEVICGGYPCQPFSHAGARAGESDARHLWPEVARCVRAIRPRWVLLENVSGHLSLGFGSVLGDLATLGFDAWWDCIPAAAIGAPHLRDRVFVVAWRQDRNASDNDRKIRSNDTDPDRSRLNGLNDASSESKQVRAARMDLSSHWVSGAPVAPFFTVADGVPSYVVRSGLKQAGNAIVPQIPEMLGRIIMELQA